jgi:hypothetical protein
MHHENFQTLDSNGVGIFDIKNLKNHNDRDTLMLPGINDHKFNTPMQVSDFDETPEPNRILKIRKKSAKSNVIIDK